MEFEDGSDASDCRACLAVGERWRIRGGGGRGTSLSMVDYDGQSRIKYQLIMRDDAPSPPNARMPKRREYRS